MSQYISILIWIGFLGILANVMDLKHNEIVLGERVQRYYWVFAMIAFVPVIYMAGNRGSYFADTYNYVRNFREMPNSFSTLPAYIDTISKDKGYYIASTLIKILISADEKVYLLVVAIFQGIVLVTVYRKYSSNYLFSIFLFFASSDYISWMFNGIRQFTAVTIIFAGTTFFMKKKYVPAIALVLLASTFHRSALIMLPFVLVSLGKAWNKRTLFFVGIALMAVVFVNQFTDLLDSTLSGTQYTNVVSDYTEAGDDGTNPLRVALYSIPGVLSFIGRRRIQEENNQLIHFCANMSIVSMGLYVVSMFTSGIFLGRLPIYVSLYGYILLPWEIENLFTEESKKIVYVGVSVIYLVFYYYQMHIAWTLF